MSEQNSHSGGGNLPDVAASSNSGNASSSVNGDLMSASAVRDWIETKNKKAALKLEKLDTDLKNYKSNSIKVKFIPKHHQQSQTIINFFMECCIKEDNVKHYQF